MGGESAGVLLYCTYRAQFFFAFASVFLHAGEVTRYTPANSFSVFTESTLSAKRKSGLLQARLIPRALNKSIPRKDKIYFTSETTIR